MAVDPKDEVEIPLEPVRRKLSLLHVENLAGGVYTRTFAQFLSEHMDGDVTIPTIFVMSIVSAFDTLDKKRDQYGHVGNCRDADEITTCQWAIRRDIPKLIAAVSEPPFSDQAIGIWEELDEVMRNGAV
jgi:hypothetical protein